jgi:hypothetical protein
MSIDYSKHAYVKVGLYSNVVNEIAKDTVQPVNCGIHSFMEPLITKLSLRHPEWTFVGEDSWCNTGTNTFNIKRFRVYEGNEEIGGVLVDTWREPKFEIRNARIRQQMAKRNHKSTKDVNKAIKLIEEHFSSKTLDERVTEGRNKVSGAISSKTWATTRDFDAVMGKLAPALATYVTLNMDRMRPILEAYGAPASALDVLVERNETQKLFRHIGATRNAGTGTTVLLHGDRYVLLHDADRERQPQVLTASQLSEGMRGKLGMLKLVDNETAIESIGMRVDATTFYLLP